MSVATDPIDTSKFETEISIPKGNVKLAISTNGKSPTLAKRMRQLLDEIIPENINELAENLNSYRKSFKDDISNKVSHLNALTRSLLRD